MTIDISNKNIYIKCEKLGLETYDIDKFLFYKKQIKNSKNNQTPSSDLYKHGGRYGTVSIRDF